MRARASLVGLAISAVALAGVVWWALRQEPPELPDSGREVAALVGAVALYAVNTLLRGERWQRLLALDGVHAARADTYALTVVGYMGNNVLPARAGDALRVVLLAPRANASRRSIVGTLLAERLLDVAVIFVLFAVVGYGLLGEVGLERLGLIALVIAGVAAAAVGGVVVLRRSAKALAFVDPVLSATLRLRSRTGASLLAATVVIWALEACVWMAAGAAVGFDMTLLEGIYLVTLASVFALIPSGPGYAGTQDAATVIGIHALGGSGKIAVAYLVTLRFVLFVPITLAGLILLMTRYGGIRRLRGAEAR